MEQKQYVLNIMAANRVGILAALATALDELGGSFVDVSHAVMRDFFSIMTSVEFPASRDPDVIVDHIRAVCRPFAAEVTLREPLDSSMVSPPTEGVLYLLRLEGRDHPGVLRRVSLRLAQEGIDIVKLYGVRDDAFRTFASCLEVSIPTGVDVVRVHRDLEQMLQAENVHVGMHRDDILQAISQPAPLSPQPWRKNADATR